MSLTVKVKSASKLPNIERFGKSDPFVVLKFRGNDRVSKFSKPSLLFDKDLKKETKVIDNELNPVWNEVSTCISSKIMQLLKYLSVSYFRNSSGPYKLHWVVLKC